MTVVRTNTDQCVLTGTVASPLSAASLNCRAGVRRCHRHATGCYWLPQVVTVLPHPANATGRISAVLVSRFLEAAVQVLEEVKGIIIKGWYLLGLISRGHWGDCSELWEGCSGSQGPSGNCNVTGGLYPNPGFIHESFQKFNWSLGRL